MNDDWRIHQDERNYSDALLLAWYLKFPYYHSCLCDHELLEIQRLAMKLPVVFSKQALRAAVLRHQLREEAQMRYDKHMSNE